MTTPSKRALIVIDLQNDYFPGGAYPLWAASATLDRVAAAIQAATAQGVPVVLVQHVANSQKGPAPFFNPATEGVAIHPRVLTAAPDAPRVVKAFADGFLETELESALARWGVEELLICGMMTQNCVTHTAISKGAEKYRVAVLTDCCTTVDQMLHKIALNALSTRVALVTAEQALG